MPNARFMFDQMKPTYLVIDPRQNLIKPRHSLDSPKFLTRATRILTHPSTDTTQVTHKPT